jgi:hypothetical protein
VRRVDVGGAAENVGDHRCEVAEHVADEPRSPIAGRVQQGTVVQRDDHRRTDRGQPPQSERERPEHNPRSGETGAQPLLLKAHVRVLVGDDPRGHRSHHWIGARGGKAAVVRQRHHFGDRQHHQLGPQAHQPAQSHEYGI